MSLQLTLEKFNVVPGSLLYALSLYLPDAETYLRPSQTSMMENFADIAYGFFLLAISPQECSSQIFNWVENTPLNYENT